MRCELVAEIRLCSSGLRKKFPVVIYSQNLIRSDAGGAGKWTYLWIWRQEVRFRSKSLGQPLTSDPDIGRKPSSWSLSSTCIDSHLLHLDQETLNHAWKQLGKLLQDADTETHSRVQWSLDVYIFNTVPRYQCWSIFWNTQWKMSPKIISQLLSSSYIRVFQVLLSE